MIALLRYTVCFTCLLTVGCRMKIKKEAAKAYTISVTDLRNKVVQLKTTAERVVCLFNGSFDAMYMLGAEKALVGIPSNIYSDPEYYDSYAKIDERIKGKKILAPGSWQASNIETIVSLHPDVVIISISQRDAIDILEKMGIAVYAVGSETYQQIYKEMLDIGTMTGTAARAKELVAYSMHKFAFIRNSTKDVKPRQKVYYAWSGGRILSTSGTNSMINDFIELAGATNVCRSKIDQPNVNAETLIDWDPDIIVLWGSNPADVYKMSELSSLKAVKNKKVRSMAPGFFYNTHTLKILFASVTLNHWCYDTNNSGDLEKDKKEIITTLYGQRGLKLLQ